MLTFSGKGPKAYVSLHAIKFGVYLPETPACWDFIKEFGVNFEKVVDEEKMEFGRVDDYYLDSIAKRWCFIVSINKGDEDKFYKFFQEFCQEHDIPYDDPKEKN